MQVTLGCADVLHVVQLAADGCLVAAQTDDAATGECEARVVNLANGELALLLRAVERKMKVLQRDVADADLG